MLEELVIPQTNCDGTIQWNEKNKNKIKINKQQFERYT